MPVYAYTAVNASGREYSDTTSAESLASLESHLQSQGAWLVKARVAKDGGARYRKRGGSHATLKRWELINFYTQLSLLINAGVPLAQALDKLADDLEDGRLGPIAQSLAQSVQSGTSLPVAMAQFPKAFSSQSVALIEAGEASGKLPEAMDALSRNLEWLDGLVASARQALIYPMAICAASVGLVVLLFTVVVPRFEEIFKQLSSPMPPITLAIVGLSDFVASTWYLWLAAGVAVPIMLSLPGRFQSIAYFKDQLLLKTPFLGEMARCLALSQFSITLEMLIRSGIPLANALELCARQSGNSLVARASHAAKVAVNEGRPMSEILAQHPVFTQTFITMTQTGEKSGQLDTTLAKVGGYYNMILPRKIKSFFSVFEPTVIIALTSVVGTVALALILPILQLWNV